MDFSKEEPNLPSDSDDSDDDYVPSGAESNPPSEVESDGDDEDAAGSEEESQNTKKRKKVQKVSKKKARKKGRKLVEKTEDQNASEEDDDDRPKEKALTEEEEKKRADSLWADFMNDTKTSPHESKAECNEKHSKEEQVDISKVVAEKSQPKKEEKENKVTITEVFEFAGEEVKVTKEVDASSQEARFTSKVMGSGSSGPPPVRGRGRAPGGLSSVLGQLGKKSKLGTLEKSKLDWDRFKKTEGIDEELKTFNRGKDGYLEKQDFLQRTDLRQFEIEKGLRATRRSNR